MVIYLPAQSLDEEPLLDELSPREIVRELDKYVIGQAEAKRAVAIALRNRIRRQKLDPEMAEEVMPKNILMIGPTGVGKTEIARRLARLASSPFLKVEASKFTEVGYVGRDVESMVRDLVDIDALLRHYAAAAVDFWPRLIERAQRLELARPLWYALQAARRWLDTPLPPQVDAWIKRTRPPWVLRRAFGALAARTLPPVDPDGEPRWRDALAAKLLEARAAWLRMPPPLLAYHAAHKLWRSWRATRTATAAT